MSRILLIEDDPSAQVLLRNRLEDLDHEVVVESSGARGMMEARKGAFDLFLVDIGLGSGIDGYEVCRRLRGTPQYRNAPVVLVSGKVKNREELHKGYEAGCEAYLVKGDLSLLEDVVRAMLRLKSLQDDLALQNRLLEEQNRRLQEERQRGAELETALRASGGVDSHSSHLSGSYPKGMLLVDTEGIVRSNDRGANDLLGPGLIGRNLGSIAPDTGLEAFVRDARTERRTGFRLDVGLRPGGPSRALSISVMPLMRTKGGGGSVPRAVLLFDVTRRRCMPPLLEDEAHEVCRHELGPLVEAARETFHPGRLLGDSPAIRELRHRVSQLNRTSQPVLIRGEAGTGKGLTARVLHYSGSRSGPFVPVDCVSLAPEALELELFGTAGEAGTDHPVPAEPGLLVRASEGTLYLREIGQLPRALQRALLDVLESGVVRRNGSVRPHPTSVRLLASTTEDLDELVAKGRFERALALRFSGAVLDLPRLKDRIEDVAPLVRAYLERLGGQSFEIELEASVLEMLGRYEWPGNVRELVSTVERLCGAALGRPISPADLPSAIAELASPRRVEQLVPHGPPAGSRSAAERSRLRFEDHPVEGEEEPVSLKLYEKRALVRALRECDGDKLAAARLLKIGKSTFYRKLHEHEIV